MDQCYTNIDTAIECNLLSGVSEERILPAIVSKREMNQFEGIPYYDMVNENNLLFIDRAMGNVGRILNKGEFTDETNVCNIAFMNLDNQYSDIEVDFIKAGKSNLFKLDSTLFLGIGRTSILINEVQEEIENQFGKNMYYLISDTENLYVTDKTNDLESEIEQLNSFDAAWLESEYLDLSKGDNGKFTEEKVIRR